jgi:hypothetical protein
MQGTMTARDAGSGEERALYIWTARPMGAQNWQETGETTRLGSGNPAADSLPISPERVTRRINDLP